MRSSDSTDPRSPRSVPDAPTDILGVALREDIKLPPNPDNKYNSPILTAILRIEYQWRLNI